MSDYENSTLPKGFFLKPPHAGVPDWIKGQIGIKVSDAIDYLKEHENERGYVNLDLKESKGGKLYLDLNTFQPASQTAHQEPSTDEDLPF